MSRIDAAMACLDRDLEGAESAGYITTFYQVISLDRNSVPPPRSRALLERGESPCFVSPRAHGTSLTWHSRNTENRSFLRDPGRLCALLSKREALLHPQCFDSSADEVSMPSYHQGARNWGKTMGLRRTTSERYHGREVRQNKARPHRQRGPDAPGGRSQRPTKRAALGENTIDVTCLDPDSSMCRSPGLPTLPGTTGTASLDATSSSSV